MSLRFVHRSERAHPSVHVTSICVPVWRSTPIGTYNFGLCADLKEHTHQYITSVCVLIWRSTPIGTSLQFVCWSEGAHPSVRHFVLCADLKKHTHRYVTSVCVPIWRSTPISTSLRFVCRSEGAHPSVYITLVCVPIWRSTPISTCHFGLCANWRSTPICACHLHGPTLNCLILDQPDVTTHYWSFQGHEARIWAYSDRRNNSHWSTTSTSPTNCHALSYVPPPGVLPFWPDTNVGSENTVMPLTGLLTPPDCKLLGQQACPEH